VASIGHCLGNRETDLGQDPQLFAMVLCLGILTKICLAVSQTVPNRRHIARRRTCANFENIKVSTSSSSRDVASIGHCLGNRETDLGQDPQAGKFILTETSLCLICLSHQMHGFLAKSLEPAVVREILVKIPRHSTIANNCRLEAFCQKTVHLMR
jgi:hypothetical protein